MHRRPRNERAHGEEEGEEGGEGAQGPRRRPGEQEPMTLEPVASRGWTDCIVAATGPSLTADVAEQCRGHRVLAVNDAYRRIPFAEALYAGDADWWEVHAGCPDFAGEKWSAHD